MAKALPDGSGLNMPCHTAQVVQEWFEEHEEEFKLLPLPPVSPDLYLIKHLWDVLEQQLQSTAAPAHNIQDIQICCKRPGARSHRAPLEVLYSPCLGESELFRQYMEDQEHIRQVVITLWAIDVPHWSNSICVLFINVEYCRNKGESFCE